jgi:hypothetical protein
MADQRSCASGGRSRLRYRQLSTSGLLRAWPFLATDRWTVAGEFFDHLGGWAMHWPGAGRSRNRTGWRLQPGSRGEAAGSDRLEHCLLRLAAGSFLSRAPGRHNRSRSCVGTRYQSRGTSGVSGRSDHCSRVPDNGRPEVDGSRHSG